MHILDKISWGGETTVQTKKLCKDFKYNPTEIGCAILRACGYKVHKHLRGDISVKDSDGNMLFSQTIPNINIKRG